MNFGIKLLIVIIVIELASLEVFGINIYTPDTLAVTSTEQDTVKDKPNMYLSLATGLFINNTFGVHPLINFTVGFRLKKNRLNLSYEYRFGNSETNFQIIENDTIKTIDNYKANYIGLEYQRLIYRNISHELYTISGIGYDWIIVNENNYIQNNLIIGGYAVNLGVGYTFYIKKKHGPNLELIYHYADLNKRTLTKIDINSFLIRLTYKFGNDFKNK